MSAPVRLLIVDDSPEDRLMYRRLLSQGVEREYRFLEAESGEEGLELVRRDSPDCVLLDYRLPDVDGLEFLERVTGAGWLPVIVLTGQGSEAVAVEAMKNGAQDYLLKGTVSRESLERAVRNAIEKVALRRERRQAEEALQKMYGELESLVQQRTAELSDAHTREREARRQAEEANRLKDEFLATLSHELRTPLNAILGWSQMLRTGRLDAATSARALETIERNAKSQAQLIADILDVSRIITGKLRLQLGPVELSRIVESVLDSVRPAAEAKSIRLAVELEPFAAPLLGDADRLQQIIWNLLSNAIKFTPQGGRVDVRLRQPDISAAESVELRVSDTGVGIRPDFLPYVFDRFRQAESTTTRTHGGLGLGLSIVRHLVEQHGGAVQVESPGEGQGATFIVRLPVRSAEAAAADQRRDAEQREEPRSLPPLDGVHVLVMDDEPDTRDLVATALSHSGAQVTAVPSAAAALDALDRLHPDVLISDIGVPGEDGYSLMRKVRAREPERGGLMPALALTAYARAEDRMQAMAAGFQMHVAKPVDPAELVAAVASLVGRKNLAV